MTNNLYSLQDRLLTRIFPALDQLQIPDCILAGGTALARYYLNHRISYDLDFFVGHAFYPEKLALGLGSIGIELRDVDFQANGKWANQLHAYTFFEEQPIKVSFIEDLYVDMWPRQTFGGVVTEEIGGLYHRKLRTISGSGYGKETKGARQTARDLFDVFVLHQVIEPIDSFVEHANGQGANFPVDALSANLLAMPWFDLIDEFERLSRLPPYATLSWMGDVKPELCTQALALQRIGDLG